jgi:hypothetical protein
MLKEFKAYGGDLDVGDIDGNSPAKSFFLVKTKNDGTKRWSWDWVWTQGEAESQVRHTGFVCAERLAVL